MDNIHEGIRQKIASARTVLVTSHQRPDGDAVGSMLALGLAIEATGKNVQMILADGLPKTFEHLPGYEKISTTVHGIPELWIVVDCADRKRINVPAGTNLPFDINIDHHISNETYAEINCIESNQAATASLLADHLPAWGLQITPPVAANLMTGIITDTLGFRTTSVDSRVMMQAAQLLEVGIDMNELYMRGLVNRSFEAARYWGGGLNRLERDGRIVWASLSLEDRVHAGYGGNDDADLINFISAIDGFDVSLLFVEQAGQKVKASWRTRRRDLNVSDVAQTFGGGGHAAAAGAEISGTMPIVQGRVLSKTKEMLGL